MGQKKIILDTNILISAFGWQGKPHIVFNKIVAKEYGLVSSPKQLDEVRRVLDYEKFNFTQQQKQRFIALLERTAEIIETTKPISLSEDADDNNIIAPAQETRIHYIITGDKSHLLPHKKFKKAKIVTAAKFLEIEEKRTAKKQPRTNPHSST